MKGAAYHSCANCVHLEQRVALDIFPVRNCAVHLAVEDEHGLHALVGWTTFHLKQNECEYFEAKEGRQ